MSLVKETEYKSNIYTLNHSTFDYYIIELNLARGQGRPRRCREPGGPAPAATQVHDPARPGLGDDPVRGEDHLISDI